MDTSLLSRQLQEFCDAHQLYGMLRVTCKDQVLHKQSFGYANREQALPFTEDSLFTLYSMSKPFCAMGILQLVDQGLVDLDAHPGKYLPEVQNFDSRVTIRQLLQHTSGVPDFAPSAGYMTDYAPGYAHKCRQHLKILSQFPSFFEPGTDGRYSNIGYMVSALIIENISGLPYPEYMRKYVFDPLGMKTAFVDNETIQVPNRVQGYRPLDEAETQIVPCEKSHDWMLGGGDLVGTVEDVYALNKAVKHRLLLKPETWEQALTPSPLNNKGFGCTITQWHDKLRITHNGGHRGFRLIHIHLPEDDFDIILLSNSGYCTKGRSEIAEIVYRWYYDSAAQSEKPLEMDTGYV